MVAEFKMAVKHNFRLLQPMFPKMKLQNGAQIQDGRQNDNIV
jgi:hypothetical protein